jgi:hypothetical protein
MWEIAKLFEIGADGSRRLMNTIDGRSQFFGTRYKNGTPPSRIAMDQANGWKRANPKSNYLVQVFIRDEIQNEIKF